MKIIQLEVEGFRSFRSQIWRPGDLNVIIGPNASGKSNLLRVLEMLTIAASGGLGKFVQHEGGIDALVWDGLAEQIKFVLTTTTPQEFHRGFESLTYELRVARLGRSSAYQIDYEMLGSFYRADLQPLQQPFKLLERLSGRRVTVSHGNVAQWSADEDWLFQTEEGIPDDETLLSLVRAPIVREPALTTYQKDRASWKIHQEFQTHRDAKIRGTQVTRADTQLDADGQNLISVLHTLYAGNREFEGEIDAAMKAAFGDAFKRLVFLPAGDQRIQLRIHWNHSNRETSAADLSDGTLRFLYLLAILANPSPPSVIAIDEPETGLHPSMLPIVAEYARDASSRSQVILTTHSPEMLDAFGADPPTTTVVERDDGETRLRVLSDDELGCWLKNYTLGELYRSKELEALP